MNSDPTYDLGELCELADVTPRTVRYYLQQGLLPSPGRQGPATRYDRGHLDRLRLIKRLQQEHLPLAEIRRRLEELNDDAVRALVEEAPQMSPAGGAAAPVRESSAISYIRDLLGGARMQQQAPIARKSEAPPPSPSATAAAEPLAAMRKSVALDALHQSPLPPAGGGGGGGGAGAGRSTWERITLAPDVELHVRRPLTRVQNKLVERLIAEARTLFDEDR